jgi:hypothetical protein
MVYIYDGTSETWFTVNSTPITLTSGDIALMPLVLLADTPKVAGGDPYNSRVDSLELAVVVAVAGGEPNGTYLFLLGTDVGEALDEAAPLLPTGAATSALQTAGNALITATNVLLTTANGLQAWIAPAENTVAIDVSAVDYAPGFPFTLQIGTGGTVYIDDNNGHANQKLVAPDGYVHPGKVTKVYNAGVTASNMTVTY